MGLKSKLYDLLVNRDPHIKLEYERYVNENHERHAKFPLLSWMYMLRLNAVCLFGGRITAGRTGKTGRGVINESADGFRMTANETAQKLCKSEAVSFDVFDTLLFRPFSSPKDLFALVGDRLGYPDYRQLRADAERLARKRKNYTSDVSLEEICLCLEEMTGIPVKESMDAELEAEYEYCFANPFMKKVWAQVLQKGKRIVVTTDMYLSSDFIGQLLDKNGFTGYEKIFVSSEHGCGKYNGGLFDIVSEYLDGCSRSHIGDNIAADINNASAHGFDTVYYPNVNIKGNVARPSEMSSLVGSAYCGIVNARLYSGGRLSDMYEYGYKVGGLLVLGYCTFIHRQAVERHADKVLFLSRDGFILKQVYERLYPGSKTEYVYWSRAAAAKLGAYRFRYDYFRRFILHKQGGEYTVGEILSAMGLSDMKTKLSPDERMNGEKADMLIAELTERYDEVLTHYEGMDRAAKICFEGMLSGCKNALTVDCGWAGSGNIILSELVERKWGLGCSLTGLVAGTNTHNQPDHAYSDTFLQSGRLIPYCFSPMHNRDIYSLHFPAADHNVFFELLFGAAAPSFLGYEEDGDGYKLIFDSETENEAAVKEIHRGELDFISDYMSCFKQDSIMYRISGADAYAPFMNMVIGNEKNIRKMFGDCVFDRNVSGKKDKLKN